MDVTKKINTVRMMIRALCLAGVLAKQKRGELLKQFTAWSTKPAFNDRFVECARALAGMCQLSEAVAMSPACRRRVRWAYAQWKQQPMWTQAEMEIAFRLRPHADAAKEFAARLTEVQTDFKTGFKIGAKVVKDFARAAESAGLIHTKKKEA